MLGEELLKKALESVLLTWTPRQHRLSLTSTVYTLETTLWWCQVRLEGQVLYHQSQLAEKGCRGLVLPPAERVLIQIQALNSTLKGKLPILTNATTCLGSTATKRIITASIEDTSIEGGDDFVSP